MTETETNKHREWHSRGYLPHFDHAGVIQSVTFRLEDSLPAERRAFIESEKGAAKRVAREMAMNSGFGRCELKQPKVAGVVEDVLLNRDGNDYSLLAWVVMPNHVHVIIEPKVTASLSDIVQAWKSVSAKQVNALLGRNGRFWAPDYFDRYVRDAQHLRQCIRYVHQNPVSAGLAKSEDEWRWGSAWQDREQQTSKPTHADGSY